MRRGRSIRSGSEKRRGGKESVVQRCLEIRRQKKRRVEFTNIGNTNWKRKHGPYRLPSVENSVVLSNKDRCIVSCSISTMGGEAIRPTRIHGQAEGGTRATILIYRRNWGKDEDESFPTSMMGHLLKSNGEERGQELEESPPCLKSGCFRGNSKSLHQIAYPKGEKGVGRAKTARSY